MTPDVGSDSPGTPPPGRLGASGDHRADGAVRGVGRPRLRRRHLRSDPLRVGQYYRHRSGHRRSGQAQRCSSGHRPSSSSRVPHRIRLDRRSRRGGDRSGPPRAPSHRARAGCAESSSSPMTAGTFSSGTSGCPHLPQRPGSRRNAREESLIFRVFSAADTGSGLLCGRCGHCAAQMSPATPQKPHGPHQEAAPSLSCPMSPPPRARRGRSWPEGGKGEPGPPPRAQRGRWPHRELPARPAARTRESTWRASFAPTPPRPMIARWSSSVRMTGGVGATTRVARAPPHLLSRIGASGTTTRTRLRGPPTPRLRHHRTTLPPHQTPPDPSPPHPDHDHPPRPQAAQHVRPTTTTHHRPRHEPPHHTTTTTNRTRAGTEPNSTARTENRRRPAVLRAEGDGPPSHEHARLPHDRDHHQDRRPVSVTYPDWRPRRSSPRPRGRGNDRPSRRA